MENHTSRRHGPTASGEQHRRSLRAIIRSLNTDGNASPTLEELASRSGLSKSTVRYHLHYMEEHGTLRMGQLRRELTLLGSDDEESSNG